jgi:tetratricopeptide (TPR) repeat protein
MPLEEATHFLLRRAKISAPTDSEHDAAMKIAGELDGLPLALEQAGAFIEDMQSSPAEYLAYYKTEGEALRARTGESAEHASVTATFSLAFAQLPDSAKQLVRLSAFLAADAIPEELLAPAGAGGLDFHRALASAGKFCLLRRKADLRVVDIHRLVQEVVRDEMNISERQEWANHAVEAVNAQFPAPEFNNWWKCERLLPHARAVIDLIKASDLKSESAGRLLTEVGLYLKFRARHQEAENVCKLAIRVRKSVFGLTNAATAESICNLGELYRAQRRFREAKRMLRRALAIDRRIFGFEHWETATDLNNLALTHVMEGDYRGAEPMLRHSLRVRGETLGDDNWHTAQSRNNLGYVCIQLGLLDEAKVLLGRAYEFREDRMGPDHPDTAETVGNLALLSSRLGHQEEAISLFERALAIKTKTLGVDHPDTVFTRRNYNVILGLEAGPDFRSP